VEAPSQGSGAPASVPQAANGAAPGLPTAISPGQIVRNLVTLEQAPAFFTLPDYQLRRLARRVRVVELGPHVRVVEQGQMGDSIYVIEHGTCLLTVEGEGGHAVSLSRLGDGDLCGETAVLDEPSAVTVTTATPCRLLALDQASLHAVLPEASPSEAELRRQMARRNSSYKETIARAHWASPSGEASVIAAYASKGGAGRTTIAINLAAQLARDHPGSVLLVDLDFPHNQVAVLSGLVPTSSLTRASWTASLGDAGDLEDALLSAAQLHASGYLVLSGALRVMEAELVDPEQVTRAIRALKSTFRYIIVDLGIALNELALSVIDLADHLVLILTPELPSLKSGRDVLQIFRDQMHMPEDRVTLVLNHRQANAVVAMEAVERTLGRPPAVEIGHDGNKPERAVMAGTVLALTDPKSEIARGTRRLAEMFATDAAEGKEASP